MTAHKVTSSEVEKNITLIKLKYGKRQQTLQHLPQGRILRRRILPYFIIHCNASEIFYGNAFTGTNCWNGARSFIHRLLHFTFDGYHQI